MNTEEIVNLHHQYVMNTYNRYPIALVKGKGARVWDAEGKEYLDFLGGIAVTALGHGHPAIIQAILDQAHTLMHASNLYYTKPSAQLAELLVLNGGLDKVFFCNSGAEANEGAIKLARKYQWRKGKRDQYKIVTATHSFHGRTLGALAATQKPEIQEGFGPLPTGFESLPWNDGEAVLSHIDDKTAAVLIEPIQGEGGIHIASHDFLKKVRAACNAVGALLIFDEIQCGVGRSGTLFAYQNFDLKPDIITLAKGIAGGLPLGVICATHEVSVAFQPGDHGTTFGANPVATAAACALVQTLVNENYPEKVAALGDHLISGLNALQGKYPNAIAAVRGKGLMIGVELKVEGSVVLKHCHARGLLVNVTAGNVLRLLPPYTITHSDIDFALTTIEQSLLVN